MRIESLFQFKPKEGFLFRVNPFLKILFMFVFSVFCFSFQIKVNLILLAFLIFLLTFSQIPVVSIFSSLKAIQFFVFLSFFGNLFLQPGREIFEVYGLHATYEGLIAGILVALRLFNLLMLSLAVSLTTSQTELAEAFEKMLSPLKLFKVNTAEIAFIVTLTIRALMILANEVLELKKYYQTKGIIRKKMRLKEQLLAGYYVIVPMVILTLRRSEEMAFALLVRGYRPDRKKIILERKKCGLHDFIFVFMSVFVFLISVFAEAV